MPNSEDLQAQQLNQMKNFIYYLPLIIFLMCATSLSAKKKKYPNGDYYEGQWKKKMPHGEGTMKYANGDLYIGNWVFGKYSGEGTKIYKNNSILKYTGQWENNKPEGYGCMEFRNGDIYTGQFERGAFIGEGEMRYKKEGTYKGMWSNGVYNGNGIFTRKNGDEYNGKWNFGDFYKGYCIIQGVRYEGEFKKNKLVNGKMTNPDGTYLEGIWNKNIFTGESDIKTDSCYYKGYWENGKFINGVCNGNIKGNHYNGKVVNGNFIGECELINCKDSIEHFKGKATEDGFYIGTATKNDKSIYKGKLTQNFDYIGNGIYESNNRDFIFNGEWDENGIIKKGNGTFNFNEKKYDIILTAASKDTCTIIISNNNIIEGEKNFAISKNIDNEIYKQGIQVLKDKQKKEQFEINKKFYNKYLKEKAFLCKIPLVDYFPGIELFMDTRNVDIYAIDIYEGFACYSPMDVVYIIYPKINKERTKYYSTEQKLALAILQREFVNHATSEYIIENNTIKIGKFEFTFNPSKRIFYDKNNRYYKPNGINEIKEIMNLPQ